MLITQELSKETTTPSLFDRIKETLLPSVPLAIAAPTSSNSSPFSWTKVQYSRWVEGVKQQFKVGDLVCLKYAPRLLGKAPFYYKIAYIQEIHYEAKMDYIRKVPKAMGLVIPGTVTPTWRTPDELRHLTQEELTYVNDGAKEEFPEPDNGTPVNTTK